jgi:hypothetical protein
MSTNFQAAIEKATIKRAIGDQLAKLPVADRRDVLADLLLELDGPPKSFAEAVRRNADEQTLRRKTTPATTTTPGRPTGTTDTSGKSRTAAVEAALRAHPRMSIADVAKLVYPDGGIEATHKVRAILFSLKQQGRAKNVGRGEWEVVS